MMHKIILVLLALAWPITTANALCTNTSPGSCVQQDDGVQREQPTLGENGVTGGAITLNGASSGSVFITPQSAAGAGITFTLPNASGTPAVSTSAPLNLSASTGALTLSTPLAVTYGGTGLAATTANQVLYSSATSTIAGLTTANNGILITNGSGVPSIGTGAAAEQLLLYTQTGTGAVQRNVDARLKDYVSLADFGASGSAQTTTGTIGAGSATLTLALARDFATGQGIRVDHAGATFALNPPTVLTVTPTGTTGGTTYTYTIASIDNAGGVGAYITPVSTNTGNATLSQANYNALSWTGATGTAPAGYIVCRSIAGTQTLIGIVSGTTFNDVGFTALANPDWAPSACSAAALNDYLVTSITAGGGTTTLTLAAAATNAITSQTVTHDDTTAVQYAVAAAYAGQGSLYCNSGTYYLTSGVTISSPLMIWGAGIAECYMLVVPPATTAFGVTTTAAVTFEGFTIQAIGQQVSHAGITFNPSPGENSSSHILNMQFTNLCNAIDFERASGFFVSHSTFAYGTCQQIIVRNLNNPDSGDSEIDHNNMQFIPSRNASMVGIYQEASGGLKVLGNKINNAYYGYYLNALGGMTSSILPIIGNSIENCVGVCILLTSQSPAAGQWRAVQISGNELMTIAAGNGIQISASSTATWIIDVSITGNTILNQTGAGSYGIYVDFSTAVLVANNTFEDISGGNNVAVGFTANASIGNISHNSYRGYPAGYQITNASTTTVIDEPDGIAIANLPAAAANGSRMFLTDGAPASSPCTGTSTGSTAFRQNGAWKCF